MSKLRKIILGVLLFMPVNVWALSSGALTVSCSPKQASAGDTVNCTVAGTSDAAIGALEAKINVTSTLATIDSFTKSGDSWDVEAGLKSDGVTLHVVSSNNVASPFSVGVIKLKIKADATPGELAVSLSDLVFVDTDNNELSGENFTGGSDTVNVVAATSPEPSTGGLRALDCNYGGVFSPSFNASSSNRVYGITLSSADTTAFSMTFVANDTNATVTFKNEDTNAVLNPNNITFNPTSDGIMSVLITVVSGSSTVEYTVLVRRPESPDEGSGSLSSLTVGGETVTLISGKTEYTVELDNIDTYQVHATVNDSTKFEIRNASDVIDVDLHGAGNIAIIVASKNSTSDPVVYTITVAKKGSTSPTPTPSSLPATPPDNPHTWGGSSTVMAIILVLSLGATIYLYKRNISEY